MCYIQSMVRALVFCMILVLAQAGSRVIQAEDSDFLLYLPALSYAKPEIPISPTMLASITADGKAGNSYSTNGIISATGRYVVFESGASDLIPEDTNGQLDVFVYDLHTRTMERVSVRSDGTQLEGMQYSVTNRADISADGRYVVFASSAALIAEDTNFRTDLYVRDRLEKTTVRLSILSAGIDGQQSNGESVSPSISDDGQWISFISEATNLVPNTPSGAYGVYLHNRLNGETRQIATDRPFVRNGDVPTISADGRYVTFVSENSDLVSGDTNGVADAFVYEVATGQIERVSFKLDGSQHNYPARQPTISGDGRFATYLTFVNFDVGDTVFLFDRIAGQTIWMSDALADGPIRPRAEFPRISDDGNSILFAHTQRLVADDLDDNMDIYAYHRSTASYERISPSTSGNFNSGSTRPAVSADSSRVVFTSYGNLLGNDDNSQLDVYMRTR